MPAITSDELGIAVDLNGCPNRCRHCYLGSPGNIRRPHEQLRSVVGLFRAFVNSDANRTPVRRLAVRSWCWEPDYSDDYRELYALEKELGDSGPYRHELLSVWRLATDPSYAEWAKTIGPDTCQISFFGMEATTDWFYRRGGAFRDGLRATERLLEVGMKPRWQLFLSKRLIPELPEFLKMAERLRLRERVEELGGEFDLFMHTPSPDGEARHIEALRPTIEDISLLPAEIIESTRKHFADPEFRWIPENEIVVQIVSDQETFPYAYTPPERLWFLVRANGDVFSNHGAQDDWWRLGNLQKDTVADLFARFQNNTPLGLHTIYTMSPRELTKRFGDPASKKVHDTKDDLFMLYVGKYCQAALSHHV